MEKIDKSLKLKLVKDWDLVNIIIVINVIIFFFTLSFPNSLNYLGVYNFTNENFHVYQILTHMFTHGGIFHIFMNMYVLYMFGKAVDKRYGQKKFLLIYFLSGIGGVLLHNMFSNSMGVAVGASACIYGIITSYIFIYPKQSLGIVFLPFRFIAWKFIILVLLIELIVAISFPESSVGHFAHIGGAVTGYLISVYYKYKNI